MIIKESPLKGMNIGTVATVAIRELPGLHTIDLRVAPGTSTQAAVAEALGMDLPGSQARPRIVNIRWRRSLMPCALHRTGGLL